MKTHNLPQRLVDMLETSNSRATYHNQLHIAKLAFESACHVGRDGGTFRIDLVLITYISSRVASGADRAVVLDVNDIPILINNLPEFLEQIEDTYHESLNRYWDEIQRIRTSKNPAVIVEAPL